MVTAEELEGAEWLSTSTNLVAWSGHYLADWLLRAQIPALITKNDAEGMTALIYTATRVYSIHVREPLPLVAGSHKTMGCTAAMRAPEPGKSGTDGWFLVTAGVLTNELWTEIMSKIVMRESVGPTERKG